MHDTIAFVCRRCGNKVFRPEPTGWGCVICGHFEFKEDCTLQDCWMQFKVNSQFAQLDNWPDRVFPVARSWGLITEIEPPFQAMFQEYAQECASTEESNAT